EPPEQLGGQVPGVHRRAAVAEEQHLPARGQRLDDPGGHLDGLLDAAGVEHLLLAVDAVLQPAADQRGAPVEVYARHVVTPSRSNPNSSTLVPNFVSASATRCFFEKSQ